MNPRVQGSLVVISAVLIVLAAFTVVFNQPLFHREWYRGGVATAPGARGPRIHGPMLAHMILNMTIELGNGGSVNRSLLAGLIDGYLSVNTTPLIIGEDVVFIYRPGPGEIVTVDGRMLHKFHVYIMGEWMQPLEERMISVDETHFVYHHRFPRDAAVVYNIIVNGDIRKDPYNPHWIPGFSYDHSLLVMPGHRIPEWINPPANTPRGNITYYYLKDGKGWVRRVAVYKPPVKGSPEAIIYFLDDEYYSKARVIRILDYLTANRLIPPVYAVLVSPGINKYSDKWSMKELRSEELFITGKVIPFIEEDLGLRASERILVGVWKTGLLATMIALDHPGSFKILIAHVPDYSYNTSLIIKLINTSSPDRGMKMYIVHGVYEPRDYSESTATIIGALKVKGFHVEDIHPDMDDSTLLSVETLGEILIEELGTM